MKISKEELKKDINISKIILIITIIVGGFFFHNKYFGYYIFAKFEELGPVTKNMPVYYKGFQIGKTEKVSPDDDYRHSIVKINIQQKDTKLPENTYTVVDRFPDGQNYLELVYPDKPALRLMKKGTVIEGKTHYSLESFMRGQAYSGADIVSENVSRTLASAEETNKELRNFFSTATDILEDNRDSIKQITTNTAKMTNSFAQMADNLNKTSNKINVALNANQLKNVGKNIELSSANIMNTTKNTSDTTQNFKSTSENINDATKDIDKIIKKIDATICQAHSTAYNLNVLTNGLNELMNKRFAGLKIFFGKPIDSSKKNQQCCPNKS